VMVHPTVVVAAMRATAATFVGPGGLGRLGVGGGVGAGGAVGVGVPRGVAPEAPVAVGR
jgi:hypothetical protein